jgi:glycosyltransferase involved in cell wall biosynthesis
MQKLSIILTTLNESHNIVGVLESVKWADEILVADSFSTDDTCEIAKKYTDRVYQRKFISYADQKNWTIEKATHEWVYIIDADERMSPALRDEIQEILKNKIEFDVFDQGRENYFMGQKVRYSGWQGDTIVRLCHRDKCRYEDLKVHEDIITEGLRMGHLKNKLKHNTFKDMDHFLDKTNKYAKFSAKDHFEKTPRVGWFHLWIKPAFRFFKHFILKRGFLDGKVGFIISILMSWGVFLRYLQIKEWRANNETPE